MSYVNSLFYGGHKYSRLFIPSYQNIIKLRIKHRHTYTHPHLPTPHTHNTTQAPIHAHKYAQILSAVLLGYLG